MSFAENPYRADFGTVAAFAEENERADFITKTYLHLAGAVAAFVAIEAVLLQLPGIESLAGRMVTGWNWLIVLGAFLLVSYVAQSWATSAVSLSTQYMGLGLYVVAEAVIFVPLLVMAKMASPGVIPAAGLITLMLFGGLTAVVFITRHDFSFLRSALYMAGFAALAVIVASIVLGFDLGVLFSGLMIAFACGYILYDTSNVLHHYRVGQHVAASLALFASVALLFWYVLRLLMSRD